MKHVNRYSNRYFRLVQIITVYMAIWNFNFASRCFSVILRTLSRFCMLQSGVWPISNWLQVTGHCLGSIHYKSLCNLSTITVLIDTQVEYDRSGIKGNTLTHFKSMCHFSNPWKSQKTSFLTFSLGIKIEHWLEMSLMTSYQWPIFPSFRNRSFDLQINHLVYIWWEHWF